MEGGRKGGFTCLLTFPAPFPGPANAMIVTPTPLKADAVPSTGLVISPRVGGVCFHYPPKHANESSVQVQSDSVSYILNKWRSLFSWLRLLGTELCLEHKRLPSQLSPRKVLRAAKAKKMRLVLVSADLQRATVSPDELSCNTRAFPFFAGHSKAGSDRGSPCGLDQVPSPASLISSSCTPLVKNEQKQVGALPPVYLFGQFLNWLHLKSPYSLSTLVIFPLLLCDRAADQHTYLPNKSDGATSTLASKRSAAWFPLWRPNQMWVRARAWLPLWNIRGLLWWYFRFSYSLFQFPPSCMQITNAVTLQKTVEHIGKLQQERQQLQEEVRRLREEIEELNSSIK